MADSKRLLALKALSEHIQTTVTKANGYQHDLAGVARGKLKFSGMDVPFVVVNEAIDLDQDMPQAGSGLQVLDAWPLYVQGWAEDDTENPTDPAYRLMADVQKALARILIDEEKINRVPTPNESYMLGGAIEGFVFGPGRVRPPDETSAYSYFYLPVVMHVAERLDDPYAV